LASGGLEVARDRGRNGLLRGNRALKLCFIADGRAMHIHKWIRHFVVSGFEVHLISTYPCDRGDPPVASLHVASLDFSAGVRARAGGAEARTTHGAPTLARLRGGSLWRVLADLRDLAAPSMVRLKGEKVRRVVESIRPDLVLAQRIPFEGILAAHALRDTPIPLLISSWGTDFTWIAARSSWMAGLTRKALERADGFHADCRRDLRLARQFGFSESKPSTLLIGNGGIIGRDFHPGMPDDASIARYAIPAGAPVVINARGVKPYIRNDDFFRSIPRVLRSRPGTIFLCVGMQGNALAQGWVSRLKIGHAVRLLPFVGHSEMGRVFRLADVAVSPSDHDGTPNSMLEALACGLFPVVGDVESVREWIEHGVNGLLCDQKDPDSIAEMILRAFDDEPLRRGAAELNRRMVAERADHDTVMADAVAFYSEVIGRGTGPALRREASAT
jgi:glycosyltransferase involved in cell wall biosynthesis